MFKKTLIAVALAGLSANAMAVNVASTPVQHSIEAAKSATSFTVADATATATMKAEYKVDDLVTLTYSQPFADDYSAPVNILVNNTDGAATSITLGKLSQTANTVVYRVTDISISNPGVASTVGAVVDLPAVTFKADGIKSAKTVTVKYSATLSNGTTPLDQAAGADTDTAELLKLSQQYATAVETKLNGVVDVTGDRKTFVGDVVVDQVALTLTDAVITDEKATLTKVVYTVNGDFSFLDNDPDTDGVQVDPAAVVASAGAVTVEADKIVITQTGVDAVAGTTTVDITNTEDAVLPAQTFTADAALTYTDRGAAMDGVNAQEQTDTTSAMDAGAWTLNGASVDVPYMPYGAAVEQFLWVTNKGAQTGDIKVTAFDQAGKAYGPFTLGTSTKGLVKLDAQLKAALVAAGLDEAKSPRLALNVTVNAPAKDINVYAAYKAVAADDRLTLPVVSLNTTAN